MNTLRRARAALVLAALLCAAALPAFAGWEEDYKEALQAYEEGSPRQAAKLLRAALEEKDKEKVGAIKASGMFFEPYLPHFYLGLVLFQLEDYEGAVRELQTSESTGVIRRFEDLHARLRQTLRLAEAAAAAKKQEEATQVARGEEPAPAGAEAAPERKPPEEAPRSTPAKAEPAQGAAEQKPAAAKSGPVTARPERLDSTPAKQAPAGPDPALQQAINGATNEILAAGKLKADGAAYLDDSDKRRLDTLTAEIRGASTAQEARAKQRELKAAVDSLSAKVTEQKRLEAQRAREERTRQERLAANRALKEAADRTAPTLDEAERFARANRGTLETSERQGLERRIAAVRNANTPDALRGAARALREDLDRLQRSVNARTARAEGAARERYSEGARAYFEGRYDDAISALGEASAALPREADLHAFMGCALYKQFLLGRSRDDSLKTRAERAFREALAIEPSYRLDARYFPPKVIAFFREVAAGS